MTRVGTGVTWPRLINSCTNRRGPAKHQVGLHKATSWSCCRIYLYEVEVWAAPIRIPAAARGLAAVLGRGPVGRPLPVGSRSFDVVPPSCQGVWPVRGWRGSRASPNSVTSRIGDDRLGTVLCRARPAPDLCTPWALCSGAGKTVEDTNTLWSTDGDPGTDPVLGE